jgi:hypothetical protein
MALIQEYRELEKQGQTWSSAKISPMDFDWGINTAPGSQSMSK